MLINFWPLQAYIHALFDHLVRRGGRVKDVHKSMKACLNLSHLLNNTSRILQCSTPRRPIPQGFGFFFISKTCAKAFHFSLSFYEMTWTALVAFSTTLRLLRTATGALDKATLFPWLMKHREGFSESTLGRFHPAHSIPANNRQVEVDMVGPCSGG
jgi:hypothetical protein